MEKALQQNIDVLLINAMGESFFVPMPVPDGALQASESLPEDVNKAKTETS